MVLDSKKIVRSLKKKGFIDAKHKSIDHKYFEFYHNDKLVAHTKLSHSSKEIDSFLIKKMSEQCKLSKNEFADLVNCPLSQNDYILILNEKELLD